MSIIISSNDAIGQYTFVREGELKLGQVMHRAETNIDTYEELERQIAQSYGNCVIVGIPEDIGVRANYGRKGARDGYDAFLKSFVNIQNNQFLNINSFYLLGAIDVSDLMDKAERTEDVNEWRALCEEVDERVFNVIVRIVQKRKIPIVIGGGHNNSFPIIKGTSLALGKGIEVLNIDPHADFRKEEGRHSGNGFSYAFNAQYLSKYSIFGLHQNYNNQYTLDQLIKNNALHFTFHEDVLLREATLDSHMQFHDTKIGLELDLDSIKEMPSSAYTPTGFTEEEVRKYLYKIVRKKQLHYVHICEGAPSLSDNPTKVGKYIAYLVSGILKQF